ncbi:restriction endonuclease subunit S [Bradyrhizobium zhanjiangense]|uniref:Type I restriction modification DNA specificity domain-containing protein n=1 Tax=Bradyrhizobium zhanjiangense TaxID=1325107 RepID=A0ABY0DBM6_9BRAD|nr:restriction endonuclease subunit S [Bradyrhizobium zhanjiangense]RXG87737.1 hypothetical protein EAS62_35375 [Bradyrhizobium zhanjiangense]
MRLPEGWAAATVEELAGPEGLVTDGDWVESKDQDANGDVRLIQLADIGEGEFRDRSSRFMRSEVAAALKCTYLSAGDVLIARMPDPLGRACLFPGLNQPAVTAVDVMIWRTDRSLADPNWFVRAINSPTIRARMTEEASGTTRQRVAGGRIKGFTVPLPPTAEQRRIVAKLDALFARLARARAETEKALRLASRARAAILKSSLSEGVARNWAHATVEEIMTEGQIGLVRSKEEQHQTGVPYIRMNHYNSEGRWNEEKLTFISCTPEEKERFSLREGDVLFNTRNSGELVGKVAIWPQGKEGYVFNNNLLRMRFREGILPDFVALIMMSPTFQEQLAQHKSATTSVAAIYLRNFYKMRIPLPSFEEQVIVAERTRKALRRLENSIEDASRARALLDRLAAAVLTKAFNGELVPQDPNEEPASLLLERIRAARAQEPQSRPKRGRKAAAPRMARYGESALNSDRSAANLAENKAPN